MDYKAKLQEQRRVLSNQNVAYRTDISGSGGGGSAATTSVGAVSGNVILSHLQRLPEKQRDSENESKMRNINSILEIISRVEVTWSEYTKQMKFSL